jgi:hypothetical protein
MVSHLISIVCEGEFGKAEAVAPDAVAQLHSYTVILMFFSFGALERFF